jgi:hypothetical protein
VIIAWQWLELAAASRERAARDATWTDVAAAKTAIDKRTVCRS